jgi:hypothetical protein
MKKVRVEDCRSLCVFQLVKDGDIRPSAKTSGVKTWRGSGLFELFAPKPFIVAYEVFPVDLYRLAMRVSFALSGQSVGLLSLFTTEQTSREIEQIIPVVSTQPNYGGHRFWFLCPLCDHRVAKVYLPEKCDQFGCRHCHNLTYRSSQTAHQYDGIYRDLADEIGGSMADAKRNVIDQYGPFKETALAVLKSNKVLVARFDSLGKSSRKKRINRGSRK